MVDNHLTVEVDADTESAVEAIDEVTEAIERLNKALSELENPPAKMELNSVGDASNATVHWPNSTTNTDSIDLTE